jgi:2-oxoglutarate dehydrogenase E2 component (dihydrolipoamide succinyltransferase)
VSVSQIVVPQLGESVVEARVARWLKKVGDSVTPGEPVVELETDKIDLEVGADQAGVLTRIDRQEGDDVKVGELLAVVEPGAAASAGASAGAPAPAAPEAPAQTPQPAAPAAQAAPAQEGAAQPETSTAAADVNAIPRRAAAPPSHPVGRTPAPTATARRMADDHAVDLSRVAGTGEGGRITKEDVQKYLTDAQAAGSGLEAAGTDQAPGSGLQAPGAVQSPAADTQPAPAARRQAPAASEPPPAASRPAPAAPARARKPGERMEERVRMSKRRATIARRLVEAQHNAAMLTTFNEVDMSAVMALRTRRKEAFQKRHGVSLGLSSFFVKASLGALRAFPRLNAEIQGDEMVLKGYYDIGIAVGASGGLVVPVLRDVDTMSFAEIEFGVRDYAKRAEDGSLTLDDLTGGTFTMTNGGVFGSLLSTPILNPPQVGILGLHKIEERPVAVGGQVVIKPMMYVALSYDHRIVDGLEAVQFLVKVKELIEDPGQMLIEL